jgi:hypothetical protein
MEMILYSALYTKKIDVVFDAGLPATDKIGGGRRCQVEAHRN